MIEEEAHERWGSPLENDEKQREFHLYLEILAQIFHAFHCHVNDNGLAGLTEFLVAKLSILLEPVLPLPIQLSSSPCRFQLLRKKTSPPRQA